MRWMGLDVGSKTVGVAVSDPFGWTAQGVCTIKIDETLSHFGMQQLTELVNQYQVEGFVVGLPKNMNNNEGVRAEASRRYAALLEQQFQLPVVFQDERLTTVQAERLLIEKGDVSRQKRKKVIDKLAAVLLLQNYLDTHPTQT